MTTSDSMKVNPSSDTATSEGATGRTLDEAWAEAEAALPHGGFYVSLTHTYRGWTATARPKLGKPVTEARYPSAVTALQALAARLRESLR